MKRKQHYRVAILAGAALSVFATLASAAEWRLVDIVGPVRIAIPGGAPTTGRQGQTLPTGTSVTTAAGGRATLDNGDQHIVVGPNSRLTVQPDAGGFTRIAQDLGAAMFKVDKKQVPHFRVDTPLLAAIVKGTTFTVVVEGTSDAVSVAEGLVEVRSNLNASLGSDVAAGATGTVLRDAPAAVQVAMPAATAATEPAPVNIAPIDYKAASGGLIDIAPAVANDAQAAVVRSDTMTPSNNAIGAATQDGPTAPTGGSVAAVASQIAGLEAVQRETPLQVAIVSSASGAVTSGANATGGSLVTLATPIVADTAAIVAVASGNSGNGNSGNGNSGNGNGNGNGGSNGAGGVATPVIVAVTDATSGISGGSGDSSSGNGNSGNSGNGNGNSGNSGNGNATSGNGNGNNGNGNGNGGSNAGLVTTVVTPVVATVTDTTGGAVGGLGLSTAGNGNSGNGNSGNGNGNSGNGNGNSGSGNSGNGNSGNGNGKEKG